MVARVEALIAGRSIEEALDRAYAYQEAGADAILIHSKQRHPDQILSFLGQWSGCCPVVVVPTTYYDTPVDVFSRAGISLVIWANLAADRSAAAGMPRIPDESEDRNGVACQDSRCLEPCHAVQPDHEGGGQIAAELKILHFRTLGNQAPAAAGKRTIRSL